ncbi:MAG: hypothetical protein ABR591_14450 [Candidatus Velthaea sp.]
MREHFTALAQRGFATVRDAAATANVLAALLGGLQRAAVVDGEPLDDARIHAAADMAERAIFGG